MRLLTACVLLPCLADLAVAAKAKKKSKELEEGAEKDPYAGIPERYRDDPRFRDDPRWKAPDGDPDHDPEHPPGPSKEELEKQAREKAEHEAKEEAKKIKTLLMIDEWCEEHPRAPEPTPLCNLRGHQKRNDPVSMDFQPPDLEELYAAKAFWCAKPKHHETHFCEKTYGMPEVSRNLDVMRMRQWWCHDRRNAKPNSALCEEYQEVEDKALHLERERLSGSAGLVMKDAEVWIHKLMDGLATEARRVHHQVGLAYFHMRKSDADEFHEMHEEYCQAPRHGGYVCKQWLRMNNLHRGEL